MARISLTASALGSLGLVLALATPASGTAIYTYTGNNFTTAGGAYTTSMSINASFTLSGPLAANLTTEALDFITDISSYTVADGVQVITDADATSFEFFFVSTNGAGEITAWSWAVELVPGTLICSENSTPPSNCGAGPVGDIATIDFIFSNVGANSDAPGTWTLVPEPRAALLLALGLAGLGWRGRGGGAV